MNKPCKCILLENPTVIQAKKNVINIEYSWSLIIRNGIALDWVVFKEEYFLGSKMIIFTGKSNMRFIHM